MKELANKHQTLIIASTLVAAFVWLQMRVQSILPAIMQDEYIYSMQARKLELSEIIFANYLYSWVYSSTNMCGINFYSCAKNLNLVFFAGFVILIFWLAAQFLNRWWAGAIALAVTLSPLSTYTSVFMPESMYFFFALLAMIALWQASKNQVWWHFALAGVALGLTSLVKPHALFLAAGATLYLLVVFWGNLKRQGVAAGAYLGSTLATKLGIGFLLAGPNGLTLFGGYSGALSGFISTIFGGGGQGAPAVNETAVAESVSESSAGGGLAALATNAFTQLGWQTAVIGLLAAGFLAAAAASFKPISNDAAEPQLKRLAQLLLISLVTMLFVVAAFSAQVTYSGDDHTSRLLLRYFEFLIAPLAIAGAAVIATQRDSNLKLKPIALVLALGTIATLGFSSLIDSQQMFADSTFLFALTFSESTGIFGLFFVFASLLTLLFAWQLRLGGFILVLVIGFTGMGAFGMQRLYSQASVISPIDSAGIFARDYLADAPPAEIFFIGTNKQLTEASVFWLDKPSVEKTFVANNTLVDADVVPEGVRWLVLLEGVGYIGDKQYEVRGDRFSVVRVGPAADHRFDVQMFDSPLESFSGVSEPTALGAWNTSETMSFSFKSALAPNARVNLRLSVGPSMVGKTIRAKLGDSEVEFEVDRAATPIQLALEFSNSQPSSTLEIETASIGTVLVSSVGAR